MAVKGFGKKEKDSRDSVLGFEHSDTNLVLGFG